LQADAVVRPPATGLLKSTGNQLLGKVAAPQHLSFDLVDGGIGGGSSRKGV
jgi:hypothetical protein